MADTAKKPKRLQLGNPEFFLLASWTSFGVALYCFGKDTSLHQSLLVPLLGAFALSCALCVAGLVTGLVRWRRETHMAQWLTIGLLFWSLVLLALIVPAL